MARILITGGTGSFGKAMVRHLYGQSLSDYNLHSQTRIVVFSRDEAKQDEMRQSFPEVEYITGDIRDLSAIKNAMANVDYVFHAAALKQVPNCERFPEEAIKTNVLGAQNLLEAIREYAPIRLVAISTDKAVQPINAMGLTKALMEKILLSEATELHTKVVCVRYGNVIGSRGSVMPFFRERVKKGLPLQVTDPEMTRFLFRMSDAVQLVLDAAFNTNIETGTILVQKMPAATVGTIAKAFLPEGGEIEIIGPRPGEKKHEVLVTEDEMRRVEERGSRFRITGTVKNHGDVRPYTSENTERLDVDEVARLIEETRLEWS